MCANNSKATNLSDEPMIDRIKDERCSEAFIFNRLFAKYGPLVQVDNAWPLLGFNSKDTFNRAALARRIPLRIIRPEGRRKSFVATDELSKYLASMAQSVKGETPN